MTVGIGNNLAVLLATQRTYKVLKWILGGKSSIAVFEEKWEQQIAIDPS